MHHLGHDELRLICVELCDDDASTLAQTCVRGQAAAFHCYPRRRMTVYSEDECRSKRAYSDGRRQDPVMAERIDRWLAKQ